MNDEGRKLITGFSGSRIRLADTRVTIEEGGSVRGATVGGAAGGGLRLLPSKEERPPVAVRAGFMCGSHTPVLQYGAVVDASWRWRETEC